MHTRSHRHTDTQTHTHTHTHTHTQTDFTVFYSGVATYLNQCTLIYKQIVVWCQAETHHLMKTMPVTWLETTVSLESSDGNGLNQNKVRSVLQHKYLPISIKWTLSPSPLLPNTQSWRPESRKGDKWLHLIPFNQRMRAPATAGTAGMENTGGEREEIRGARVG